MKRILLLLVSAVLLAYCTTDSYNVKPTAQNLEGDWRIDSLVLRNEETNADTTLVFQDGFVSFGYFNYKSGGKAPASYGVGHERAEGEFSIIGSDKLLFDFLKPIEAFQFFGAFEVVELTDAKLSATGAFILGDSGELGGIIYFTKKK